MRLTLDWDDMPIMELLHRIGIVKHDFPSKHIAVEKSASGNGYHVTVYFACKTFKEQLELRKKYWDDDARMEVDRQRYKKGVPIGILFTEKRGKHVQEY